MASCELPSYCSYLAWSFSLKCIYSSTLFACGTCVHLTFTIVSSISSVENWKNCSCFWKLSSSLPKAGFLLGFQTSPLNACSPTPWGLSWAGSSCSPVSDWGVSSGSQPGFLQGALHGPSVISCCFSLLGMGILTSSCLIHAFHEAFYFSQWVHSENNLTAECQQGFPVCEWLLNSFLQCSDSTSQSWLFLFPL